MPETTNLSTKDLKSLKKEDLVRLVVNLQNTNSSLQRQRRSLSETSDKSSRASVSASSAMPEGTFDICDIKRTIIEAVKDIKTELRSEYISLLKDLKDDFRHEMENMRSEMREQKQKFDSSLREMESELLRDMQEADLRKSNLMVFGVEESPMEEAIGDRKRCDAKKVELLACHIGVKLGEPVNAIRLGRIGEKPRPIKLIGLSSPTRDELLRSAARIRHIDKSLGSNRYFIKPDLTPKQQLTDRILRNELKSRREKGERVSIRNGKIVNDTKTSDD